MADENHGINSVDFNAVKDGLKTSSEITWCPGCPDRMIFEAFKQTIAKYIDVGKYKKEDFAMVADIGCNSKMFDYLNLSGVYALHGRSLATGIGITLGNPNLKVISFAGDGAAYSEGIEHFIHAFRHNADMTYLVYDNQSFSLTTGQPTPTSQQGFKSNSRPLGLPEKPMNPLLVALSSNATFIARTNARDIPHMVETFTKAINHKGFSFVEIIQDCIIFNKEMNNRDSRMYKIRDNLGDLNLAWQLAREYDYNTGQGKIPLGVIYKVSELTLTEKWPQLKKLHEEKKYWKDK